MSERLTPAPDDEPVLFVSDISSVSHQSDPSPYRSGPADRVVQRVGELRDNFGAVMGQVLSLAQVADSTSTDGLAFEQMTVSLGIDARGKIGFIAGAEAGVKATVTVTFKRTSAAAADS